MYNLHINKTLLKRLDLDLERSLFRGRVVAVGRPLVPVVRRMAERGRGRGQPWWRYEVVPGVQGVWV